MAKGKQKAANTKSAIARKAQARASKNNKKTPARSTVKSAAKRNAANRKRQAASMKKSRK